MGLLGDAALCLVRGVLALYDLLTLPLYTVACQPWRVRAAHSRQRSELLVQDGERVVFRAPHKMTGPLSELVAAGVDTMAKAARKHHNVLETLHCCD